MRPEPSMADQTKGQLHIVMFPWLAFGHMIPYLEFAKLLALRGHRISFLSTPRNIQRLPANLSPNLSSLIDFVALPLPTHPNLPQNAESTMDAPPDKIPFLKLAHDGLRDPIARFLEGEKPTPDWVIYDFAAYWVPEIAAERGVSHAFFSIFPAHGIAYFGSAASMVEDAYADDPRAASPEKLAASPEFFNFPSKVAYRRHEVGRNIWLFRGNPHGVSDRFRLGAAIRGCDALLVRGCEELQSSWLRLLRELNGRPVVPVGLMPPAQDGEDEVDHTWREVKSWLDGHVRGSVVYVAFGSEAVPTREELTELAHGLELSGSPFLWAVRKTTDSFELPGGFEERVGGRGLVWTSWAPQLRILGHESVGGFLTHCGWSSVVEGLGAGRPLIMLPIFGDQPLNARVVQEELMAGIEIQRDESNGSVSRDSVSESIKTVMKGEEGRICREQAKKMAKIFGNEELQEKYTNQLVEYLQKQCRVCAPAETEHLASASISF